MDSVLANHSFCATGSDMLCIPNNGFVVTGGELGDAPLNMMSWPPKLEFKRCLVVLMFIGRTVADDELAI
jgi:hypothetical protein